MIEFVEIQKKLKLNDSEKYYINVASVKYLILSWHEAGYGSIEDLIFTFFEKVKEMLQFIGLRQIMPNDIISLYLKPKEGKPSSSSAAISLVKN